MDRPEDYLGRGLEDIPGKPFGYAHMMEREAIRRHLARRPWRFPPRDGLPLAAMIHFRVVAIQNRLHRNRPSFRQRQEAARRAAPPPSGGNVWLTREELERLVDLHSQANDPVTRSVAEKAALILETFKRVDS